MNVRLFLKSKVLALLFSCFYALNFVKYYYQVIFLSLSGTKVCCDFKFLGEKNNIEIGFYKKNGKRQVGTNKG